VTPDNADEFAALLLEEAKRFLEKYGSERREEGPVAAYLHAALLLGYCALEAHMNNIAADFSERREFTVLEKSLLNEKDFALKDGRFQLSKKTKMYRIEDRLEFLYRRFAKDSLDKNAPWWSHLKTGLELRNSLTHPRNPQPISEKEAADFLSAIIKAIDLLYQTIYDKPYPARGLRLQSRLTF
jgi:hypothetical protein